MVFSLKSIAQLDTCNFVIDTIFKINYCLPGGTAQCPPELVYIDTSLVRLASGLKTYLVCYDPLGLSGSISDAQIGTFNYGDTIPVTYMKHNFGFYNSGTTFDPYIIAIIVVGKPTVLNESLFCYSSIHYQRGYIYDNCSVHDNSVYFSGQKNCTVSDCTLNKQNELNNNVSNFTVYPNPAVTNITIENDRLMNGKIYIINNLGLVVKEEEIKQGNEKTIDIRTLPTGLYLLRYKEQTLRFSVVK